MVSEQDAVGSAPEQSQKIQCNDDRQRRLKPSGQQKVRQSTGCRAQAPRQRAHDWTPGLDQQVHDESDDPDRHP